jgi:pyruvate,water dikinase
VYICAVEPPPEAVIMEKAERFSKRVPFVVEHYDEIWEKWLNKFQALGREMAAVKIPGELPKYVPDDQVMPTLRGYYASYEPMEAFNTLVSLILKGWQYHFEVLNLSKLGYLTFADVARKLFSGISESAIGKMVAGTEAMMFRPDEELCRLSKLAASNAATGEIIKRDVTAEQKIAELKKTEDGKKWLAELEKTKVPWFYISCGSGWYYFEGSWINKLDIPFSYMKSYVERLGRGEKIERSLDEINRKREEIVAGYRKLIKIDEDQKSFDDAYRTVRTLHRFNEDHIFWVEHWLHTIWYEKIRDIGKLFVKQGMLKKVDDIFMFNRFEVPQMIEELATGWALGEGVPLRSNYYMEKAAKRQRILEAARKRIPTPALGIPPEEVNEPFTVMHWGVTTDKVKEWLKGADVVPEKISEIKGFASSAGVVEGTARVLKLLEEIVTIKEGEIIVCACVNPAWAPVFTKIKAAVTDIGGLTSHASIVAREYGLPAVTGTGIATSVVKTGDTIRVNGDTGVVTILKRAV